MFLLRNLTPGSRKLILKHMMTLLTKSNRKHKRTALILLPQAVLILFSVLLIQSGCRTTRTPERATTIEDIYTKPRILSRHGWMDTQPTGRFMGQVPNRITLMDSGIHAKGQVSIQYLQSWRELITPSGYHDIPVHYIVDSAGAIYAGRDAMIQAELYTNDVFSRAGEPAPQEKVYDSAGPSKNEEREARWGKRIEMDGHLVVMILSDLDKEPPTDEQEAAMLQLLQELCNQFQISPKRIANLSEYAPVTANPGQYLSNYRTSGILTKLINEPIPKDSNPFSLFRR